MSIPEGWVSNKIKNLTTKIGSGKTPKGGDKTYLDEGVLFIRSQNVYPFKLYTDQCKYIDEQTDQLMKNSRVKNRDVLLNITGASIGRSCVFNLKQRANVNQHVCIIRVKPRISPDFLCSYLNSWFGQKEINSFLTVGNREGLNFQQIGMMTISFPSLAEQQKIAKILSTWDEAIEKLEKLIELKKKRKKGLMQQLFPQEGELVPRLRFPEFNSLGNWRIVEMCECLEYEQPTPYLVENTNYNETYNVPVLTAGKSFILGYTDEESGVFTENLPVVIFDDFTTATKFVDFQFKVKSSALKILKGRDNFDIRFMYGVLQTIKYQVGAHQRHWISKFSPMKIKTPSYPEQKKIAKILSTWDEVIEKLEKLIEAKKKIKKGLMQQLLTGKKRVKMNG